MASKNGILIDKDGGWFGIVRTASTWLKDCFSIPRISLGMRALAFEPVLLAPS